MEYKRWNDYEIMYLVNDNDEIAQNTLFEKYNPIVLSFVKKYQGVSKHLGIDYEDLIQEGRIGLYNAIRKYNANGNTLFYTFACICIHSHLRNYLKLQSAQKHRNLNNSISLSQQDNDSELELCDMIEDTKIENPSLLLNYRELIQEIHSFSLDLCSEQSYIFELKVNGFTNKEISRLLDVDSRKVDNQLFRIRKKLRGYLNR